MVQRRVVITPNFARPPAFLGVFLLLTIPDEKRNAANMEPTVRFELTTPRLQGGRSATELCRRDASIIYDRAGQRQPMIVPDAHEIANSKGKPMMIGEQIVPFVQSGWRS